MATLAANSPLALEGRDTRRMLLNGGVLAAPLYVAVALGQALTRPGFDLRRHDISLLANGDLGWIQIGNFLVSGMLVLASAAGMRRLGIGGWGARLIGLYGVCIALAGVFVADPMAGFPPETAGAQATFSWHGGLHLLCAAIGFGALIAACFVLGRRFATQGRRGWATFSRSSGVLFLLTFLAGVALSRSELGVLSLWIAVLTGWSWLAAVCARGVRA